MSIDAALSELSIQGAGDHAKIVALLDTDRFAEALKTIGHHHKQDEQLALYAAYAYYRSGKESECLKCLSSAHVEDSRAVRHLRAQALYKLERTQEAQNEYAKLKDDHGRQVVNETEDLQVNSIALAAQQALLHGSSTSISRPDDNANHETWFNYAVYLSAQRLFRDALDALSHAQANLEKLGLAESEYEHECAPILAQQAFLTGDIEKAGKVSSYEADATTKYINEAFLCAADPDVSSNPYKVFKAHSRQLLAGTQLFSYQARQLDYNRILASHHIGHDIKSAVKTYRKQFATTDSTRCLALSTLGSANTTSSALEAVVSDMKRSIDDRIGALIKLISRLVYKPHGIRKSLKILDALEFELPPGLVSVRCSLLDLLGSNSPENADEYLNKKIESAAATNRIQLLAGSVQRHIARSAEPSDLLRKRVEELLNLDAKNPVGLAAKTVLDPTNVQTIALPDLSSVNLAALEAQIPRATAVQAPRIRKRKRASGPLKPEQLDPERWLPKRDRSSYRPSQQEKLRMKGAHQGGAVDESLATTVPKLEGPRKNKKKGKGKK